MGRLQPDQMVATSERIGLGLSERTRAMTLLDLRGEDL